MDFADFILQHEGDDLPRLALSRSRYGADVPDWDLALTTLEVRGKLRSKVPQWYAVPSLHYPLKLSAEQCSSAETARYKASVALSAVLEGVSSEIQRRFAPCPSHASGAGPSHSCGHGRPQISEETPFRIADLTGGLGVDAWAFSEVFSEVLYNEMKPELAAAAAHNFKELGAGNVKVQCAEVKAGEVAALLGGFHPDILFLDPARRAGDGRKVFRLEDCQPNVLELLPELLSACPKVLLKLSPMADITLVCRQLGCVRAVHVVAAEGECKELLLVLDKEHAGPYTLTVNESGAVADIAVSETDALLLAGKDCLERCRWLFEPGKALLKAGAFAWPCSYGLAKLSRHTHLYLAERPVPELAPFGKWLEILEWKAFNKQSFKEISAKYPQAELLARNVPVGTEELRRRLKLQDGGPVRIYATKTETGNYLIICKL